MEDFSYSMGARLAYKTQGNFQVPGAGTYESSVKPVIESVKSMRFGTG